jgi:hypothetical protein
LKTVKTDTKKARGELRKAEMTKRGENVDKAK